MLEHPVLFLSHSGLDTETARELKRRLLASPDAKAAGLEIWFDKDDLLPGQGWQEQLEKVIETRSTAFAVIVGTKGVVNWVDREVRVALSRATEEKNYPFIPVLVSPNLSSSLPPFARQFQGVHDPINNEIELGKLLRTVLDDGLGDRDSTGSQRAVRLTDSPFVGLRAMTEADADLFFGREAELDALVETLRANRLVAIVADSGSGKSSLAQAGLIPRIRGGALEDKSREAPDERTWQVVVMRPGAEPVENLRVGVTEAAERLGLSDEARAALRGRIDPTKRAEWVYALQCNLPVKATETVLIIDQFEELLTQTPPAKREPFIDWLMDITAESAAIPVRVVLTIRSDYFNLCSPYQAFYKRIKLDAGAPRSPQFRLKGLTTAIHDSAPPPGAGSNYYTGLAAIVHRPLILAGHTDQPERDALLAAIGRDVSDRPGDLALVQMALYEIWRASKAGRENLLEAYSKVGGVAGALAHAAEDVRTSKLNDDEARMLEAVLVRLVDLGDTGGATRRVARRDEFDTARRTLAGRLTTETCHRLLLAGADTIEICHERLITQWPWWQNCLNAAATDMRGLARLMRRAAEWSSGGGERRNLATGGELDLFKEIADRRKSWLSQTEIAFVGAAARWAMIWRFVGTAAVLALVVSTVMMSYLWRAATQATIAANEATKLAVFAKDQAIANESRALAALSEIALNGRNPHDTFKFALAAWPRSVSDRRPRLRQTAQALSRATAGPLVLLPDIKHLGAVTGALFDLAETRILSWSDDKTVRVWDASTGQQLGAPMEHRGPVHGALFDKAEVRILSWSSDTTVRLWDAATGQPLGAPMQHDETVIGALFNRAETRILSWSSDGTARLWDATTGQPLGALMKHRLPVMGAYFDQAEAQILSWSYDGTVRLWDAATGQPRVVPMKHDNAVIGARFDKAEAHILSWSKDGTVRLWDAATGQSLGAALKHDGQVYGARFDKAETRILSWSEDGTVRLWDATTSQPLGAPMKHDSPVSGALFDKEEVGILSWSADGTMRLWDGATGQPRGAPMKHEGRVYGVLYDQMEARILSWSRDGTVRLWDAATGQPRVARMKHQGAVTGARFDKAEARILSWSSDGTVRLWDVATGQPRGALMKHDHRVKGALFGNTKASILSWSEDKTVRLWDAATGQPLGAPMKHDEAVNGALFDKTEARILSWSEDKTVRLWDVATGQPRGAPMKHDEAVSGALFDKTEARVLSWSRDGTVRLWDVATRQPRGAPMKHGEAVSGALFDKAEARILSWSRDGAVRLWDVATGQPRGAPMMHNEAVNGARFDQTEARILSWSRDGTVRLWDVATGQPRGTPMMHNEAVNGARFDQAETHILSWSNDGTVRLWDAATGQPRDAPMEHDRAVNGAFFDKTESRILSWSIDRTVRLWDAATGQPIGVPMKHDLAVMGARFDQTETHILSWSSDGTVRLWDVATGKPRGGPMRHDGIVYGALFDKVEAAILSWSDRTVRLWNIARLTHGNLVEVACRLLADKDISSLQTEFGIKFDEPICTHDGKDAPAPNVNELRD